MGRSPCCDEIGLKKGPWTPEEDKVLVEYIQKNGHGSWRRLPKLAGLNRCGKSCRLRWTNYLRPDIKRGRFDDDEERLIIHLHSILGNKWSAIAARLPGRTDNEIKNYWNTHLRKKLLQMGIDPVTHQKRTDMNFLAGIPNIFSNYLGGLASSSDHLNALRLQSDAATLARVQILQSLVQLIAAAASSSTPPLSLDPIMNDHVFAGSNECLFNGQLIGVSSNQDAASLNLGGDHLDQKLINKYSAAAINPCSSADQHELFMENNNIDANQVINCSYMDNSAHSTPSLVPASPENLENTNIDPLTVQDRPVVSCFVDECMISSSRNLNPFGAWEGLDLDNPNTELCWKDILERIS